MNETVSRLVVVIAMVSFHAAAFAKEIVRPDASRLSLKRVDSSLAWAT